jgi:lauroyl/myristoyl acyltransferase
MQTQRIDSTSEAQLAGDKPGEFSHYYLNFLALFGKERPVTDIAELARRAVSNRDRHIALFDRQILELSEYYRSQPRTADGRAERDPKPMMRGWKARDLPFLRAAHDGLLVALFHYGNHRQVFYDLAVMGVPFLAPVAKRAYFECLRIGRVATPRFERAFRLIEVESPTVGRDLLRGLREGRVGLIYVDGNMGPDGHKVEEGGVEVDFFGRRIRVKEGIARLAHSLELPVLPLFVESQVVFGPLLHPLAKRTTSAADLAASRQQMMQILYQHLEDHVRRAPSLWEFAFCLHRWIVDGGPREELPGKELPARLTLRPGEVALFERGEDQYWVDVGSQRAFRLPAWARGLYGFLCARVRDTDDTVRWLQGEHADAEHARALLVTLQGRGLLASA